MTLQEYNTCVEQYADRLYRFLLKNLSDATVASDLVQDSFEKLWRSKDAVEPQKARSWLFTTGYRLMIDGIRRAKKQGDWDDNLIQLRPGVSHQYSDLQEVLADALEQLPPIQKQVVLLRDYEGYDYKEIGAITNLSESQVKVYIFRARKRLKTYIGSIEAVI